MEPAKKAITWEVGDMPSPPSSMDHKQPPMSPTQRAAMFYDVVKKDVRVVVHNIRGAFSSSGGGDGSAAPGEATSGVEHTVSDEDKDTLADHSGFVSFAKWKLAWGGKGRVRCTASEWRKIQLRALQMQTFRTLSETTVTNAAIGGVGSDKHECFDIVALLLVDASAIEAVLKSPKTFALAVGELRSGAEALVICDEAANIPKFVLPATYDANRKDWLSRIGQLKHLMKQNAFLKQDKTISCSTLAFYLSTLAFTVGALPDKFESKKAQAAGMQVLSGLYTLYSKGDASSLIQGVTQLGGMALEHYRREQAKSNKEAIVPWLTLPARTLDQTLDTVHHTVNYKLIQAQVTEGATDGAEPPVDHAKLHAQQINALFKKYVAPVSINKKGDTEVEVEVPVRWEIPAACSLSLCDIVLRCCHEMALWGEWEATQAAAKEANDTEGSLEVPFDSAAAAAGKGVYMGVPEELAQREDFKNFAKYILTGGGSGAKFTGLLGMLTYGLPAGTDEHEVRSPMAKLATWSARALTGSMAGTGAVDWVHEGTDLLRGEVTEVLHNFEMDLMSFTKPLDGLASPTVIDANSIIRLSEEVETMGSTLSRARGGMRKVADVLDLPIRMVDKVVAILRKFSALDPKMMVMGWKALLFKVIGVDAAGSDDDKGQNSTPSFIAALKNFSADMETIKAFTSKCISDEVSDVRAYCAGQLAPLAEKESGEEAKEGVGGEGGEKKEGAKEDEKTGIQELLLKIGAGGAKDDFDMLSHLANQLLMSKVDAIEKWLSTLKKVVAHGKEVAAAITKKGKKKKMFSELQPSIPGAESDTLVDRVAKALVFVRNELLGESGALQTVFEALRSGGGAKLATAARGMGDALTKFDDQYLSPVSPLDSIGISKAVGALLQKGFESIDQELQVAVDKAKRLMPSSMQDAIDGIFKAMATLTSFLRAISTFVADVKHVIEDMIQVSTVDAQQSFSKLKRVLSANLEVLMTPENERSPKDTLASVQKVVTDELQKCKSVMTVGFTEKIGDIRASISSCSTLFESIEVDDAAIMKVGTLLEKTKASMKMALDDLKNSAVEELNSAADGALDDLGMDSDMASGLLSGVGSVIGDALEARNAVKEKWRVREVAVLCCKMIAAAPSENPLKDLVTSALTKRKAFEPNSHVMNLLNSEADISTQLNNLMYTESVKETTGEKADREAAEKAAWSEHEDAIATDIRARLEKLEVAREDASKETDLIKKAQLLAQCRAEQRALKVASANVKDVGKKLDLVIGFLDSMNGQLASIDGKLSAIADQVSAMHDDLRRLTGRPVLEEIHMRVERKYKEKNSKLRSEVFIEPTIRYVSEDDDDDMHTQVSTVTKAFAEFMVPKKGSKEKSNKNLKNILLLSGAAGSGKSTAVEELKKWVVNIYEGLKSDDERVPVVLLTVNLPLLRDPIGGIFSEGLKLEYDLRDSQIDELRDKIQEGEAEIVFILDGYDELPSEAQGKNLWRTNNLEQYRDQRSEKKVTQFPKVVITCREEYLSKFKDYSLFFLPIETVNEDKDEAREAKEWFDEIRLMPFGDARLEYTVQHVALAYCREVAHHWPRIKKKPTKREMGRGELMRAFYDEWVKGGESYWGYQKATVKKIYNKVEMKSLPKDTKDLKDPKDQSKKGSGEGGEKAVPEVTGDTKAAETKKEKNDAPRERESQEKEIEFDLQYDDGVVVKRIKKSMVKPLDENKASWTEKLTATAVVEGDIVQGPHLAQLVHTLESSTIPRPQDDALSAESQKAKDKILVKSAFEWFKILSPAKAGQDAGGESSSSLRVRAGMVAVLCAVAGLDTEKDSHEGAVALLHKVNTELDIWTVKEYHKEFNDIPELVELTTTPFMVKIVTEILPRIFDKSHQRGDIKSLLVFGLGDAPSEIAYARLRDFQEHEFDLKIDTGNGNLATPMDILGREAKNNDFLSRESFDRAQISASEFTSIFTELKKNKATAVKKDKGVESISWKTITKLIASAKADAKAEKKLSELQKKVLSIFLPPPLLEAGQIFRVQRALDAVSSSLLTDSEARNALRAISLLATDIVDKIETAKKKHPDDWVDFESSKSLERKVNRELTIALRRKPTRRSVIYDEFVKMHLDREIIKNAASRTFSGLSADGLQREATEFSRQLALTMAQKGRTKLARRNRSLLFTDPSLEDIFFSDDPKAVAARKASPTKIVSGGYLSFIHKTIQENLIAEAVLAGIDDAITETMYAPSDLIVKAWLLQKHMEKERKMTAIDEALDEAKEDTDEGDLEDEDGSTNTAANDGPAAESDATKDVVHKVAPLTSTERRQLQVLFECFVEQLAFSPMANISLEDDSAVRDFICDRLLDHPRSVMVLRAVAVLVFCCRNLHSKKFETKLDTVRQNIWSIVAGSLPRRDNGTLLHEAASDGSVSIVQGLIFITSILINADGNRGGRHMLDDMLSSKTGPNQKQIIDFWTDVTKISFGDKVEFRDSDNEKWTKGVVVAIGQKARERATKEDNSIEEGALEMLIRNVDVDYTPIDDPSEDDSWYYFVRPLAEEGSTWSAFTTTDLCDKFMRTPLYKAARRGNFGVANFLIKCGSRVDAVAIDEVAPPIQVTPEAAMKRHLTSGNGDLSVIGGKEKMKGTLNLRDEALHSSEQYHGLWRAAVPTVGFKSYRRCMFEVEVRKGAYLPLLSEDLKIPFSSFAFFGVGWGWKSGSVLFFPNCPEFAVLVNDAVGVPSFDTALEEGMSAFNEAFQKAMQMESEADEGEEMGDEESSSTYTVVRLKPPSSPLENPIPSLPMEGDSMGKGGKSEGVKGHALVIDEEKKEKVFTKEALLFRQENGTIAVGEFTKETSADYQSQNPNQKKGQRKFARIAEVGPSEVMVRTSSELTIGMAVDIKCPKDKGTGSLLFGINGKWSSLDLDKVKGLKKVLDGDSVVGVEPIVIGHCTSLDLKFNTGGSRSFSFQPGSEVSDDFPDRSTLENITSEGDTALTAAAERGDAETIDLLMKKSSNKLKLTTKKESMLHLLCKHDDHENLVEFNKDLLKGFSEELNNETIKEAFGAASNYLQQRNTEHGDTAVHVAARNNSTACLIAVTKYLPSLLNVCNNDGLNPLQVAAEANNKKAINDLLDKDLWSFFRAMYMKCKAKERDALSSGDKQEEWEEMATSSHEDHAAAGSDEEFNLTKDETVALGWFGSVTSLLEMFCSPAQYAGSRLRGEESHSCLHLAAAKNSIDAIGALIDKGADFNARGAGGKMALHVAALEGRKSACEKLINLGNKLQIKGFHLNVQDSAGLTMLHYACLNGHIETTNFLLTEMGKKNLGSVPDNDGRLPFHHVCLNGKGDWKGIIRRLAEAVAEELMLVQDNNGNTGLHLVAGATRNPNAKGMIDLLLNYRANRALKNKLDQTPLAIAATANHLDAVEALISRTGPGAPGDLVATQAIIQAYVEEHGYYVNWKLLTKLLEHAYGGANPTEKLYAVVDKYFEAIAIDSVREMTFLEQAFYVRCMYPSGDFLPEDPLFNQEMGTIDKETFTGFVDDLHLGSTGAAGLTKETFRLFWLLPVLNEHKLNTIPQEDSRVMDFVRCVKGASLYYAKLFEDPSTGSFESKDDFETLKEDLAKKVNEERANLTTKKEELKSEAAASKGEGDTPGNAKEIKRIEMEMEHIDNRLRKIGEDEVLPEHVFPALPASEGSDDDKDDDEKEEEEEEEEEEKEEDEEEEEEEEEDDDDDVRGESSEDEESEDENSKDEDEGDEVIQLLEAGKNCDDYTVYFTPPPARRLTLGDWVRLSSENEEVGCLSAAQIGVIVQDDGDGDALPPYKVRCQGEDLSKIKEEMESTVGHNGLEEINKSLEAALESVTCRQGHRLVEKLSSSIRGWQCDGHDDVGGCKHWRLSTTQSLWGRFHCDECDFDFCHCCLLSKECSGEYVSAEKDAEADSEADSEAETETEAGAEAKTEASGESLPDEEGEFLGPHSKTEGLWKDNEGQEYTYKFKTLADKAELYGVSKGKLMMAARKFDGTLKGQKALFLDATELDAGGKELQSLGSEESDATTEDSPLKLTNVEFVESRAESWDDAANGIISQLEEAEVQRGQILSIDAHNNGPDEEAIFSAHYCKALPAKGALDLEYKQENTDAQGWDAFYQTAATYAEENTADRSDLVAITASINSGGSSVMYTFYHTPVKETTEDSPLKLTNVEFVESRAESWDDAANGIISQLEEAEVQRGQILSIDAHNNGPDEEAIFSAHYCKALPRALDPDDRSILSYKRENTASQGWLAFYATAARNAEENTADRNDLVAITASINKGGSSVMYTFNYITPVTAAMHETMKHCEHRLEVLQPFWDRKNAVSDTAWYKKDQLKSIGVGTCYCGRTDIEIEEGDGQCGPTNGPQCPACEQYQIQFGKNMEEVRRVQKVEKEPVLVTGAGTSFTNGKSEAEGGEGGDIDGQLTGEEGKEGEEVKMEKIFQQYRSLVGFKQNQSKQSMAKGDFIRLLSCASSKVNLTFLKDIEAPVQELLPTEEKE